jgi:major membrane immunogen (membrane-anchored lipoprotein)
MHPVRAVSMFLMMASAVLLSACSESNLAGTALKMFYEAIGNANTEKAAVLVSSGGASYAQAAPSQGNSQTLLDEAKQLIQANGGLDRVEILNIKSSEDGKAAAVDAKLKFKNGKEHTETRRVIRETDGEWKILP